MPYRILQEAFMKIDIRSLKAIKKAKYNPRKISDNQLTILAQSIERFGFVDPVIVNDRNGVLIGGHQRIKAAERLGLTHVPVVGVDLDETEEKALNVALNKISGEWDIDLLRGVLEDIKSEGLDLSLTGFESEEITSLLSSTNLIDYSVLDDDDSDRKLTDMLKEVRKGIVVDFHVIEEYEAANEMIKSLRPMNVDIGNILLKALKAYNGE
jgi:ParB-like chromosome segregation protein Spo0J